MNETLPPRKAPAGSTWKTYVLPLGLLLTIIFGLAFISQFRGCAPPPAPGKDTGPLVCRFLDTSPFDPESLTDDSKKDDTPAVGPMVLEVGQKGTYDFPFENPSDVEGEMKLAAGKCGCSSLRVGYIEEAAWKAWVDGRLTKGKDPHAPIDEGLVGEWKTLLEPAQKAEKDRPAPLQEMHELRIPPKAKGVLRAHWETKAAGPFSLTPKIVFRPRGGKNAAMAELKIAAHVVAPVQFFPPRIEVGAIPQGKSGTNRFYAWSATRDKHPEVTITENRPLIAIDLEPLDAAGIATLQGLLDERKIPGAVKVGWKGTVTVTDVWEKGGELGPFDHRPRIVVSGNGASLELADSDGFRITGFVQSDIKIGKDGNIYLGTFAERDGTSTSVTFYTQPGVVIKADEVKWEPRAEFQVNVSPGDKENQWLLNVKALPAPGTFPDRAAITLPLQYPDAPPRLIRVPLKGVRIGSGGARPPL